MPLKIQKNISFGISLELILSRSYKNIQNKILFSSNFGMQIMQKYRQKFDLI